VTNYCIDIGNSFIKHAVLQDGEIVYYKRVKKLLVREIKALQSKWNFEHAILCSTRKSTPRFLNYLKKNLNLSVLNHKTKLPFKNAYATPKTLGKDRLAAVAGALHLYPGKNCLIFDIGTCMTIDYLTKKKVFMGGNIAPGKDLRLKSMHDYTSALPLVKAKFDNAILGKSTKSALQNGAIYGICLEIEGMVARMNRKSGPINVILTGGDAIKFGELLECKKFVIPNLVLIGLDSILVHNVKSKI